MDCNVIGGRSAAFETLEARQLLSSTVYFVNQQNLVSDGAATALHVDANLKNPWGVVATGNGVLWTNDNGSGVMTAYDRNGNILAAVTVPIPAATGATHSSPTGLALNTGKNFSVFTGSGVAGPALFLIATEDGTVAGWNSSVNAASAITAIDSHLTGAIYTGLTVAGSGKNQRLYVANFHSGQVEVYDTKFKAVALKTGAFLDPALPAGFAPYNVATLNNKIYVTYAKQNIDASDSVPGAGNGFVDVYDTNGKLKSHAASGAALDSPWAVVAAPAGLKTLKGDILVGNFGSGMISAFNSKGKFVSLVDSDAAGTPVTIDGLWGLASGNKATGNSNSLLFASGPNDEADGLLGLLTPASAKVKK